MEKPKKVSVSKIREDLQINGSDINNEFIKQPALFFWYAELLEQAEKKLRMLIIKLEVYEADKAKRIRERAKEVGEKITEGHITRTIRLNKKWQGLKQKISDTQYKVSMLKAARTAFIHKKDCLISLGANFREHPDLFLYDEKKE